MSPVTAIPLSADSTVLTTWAPSTVYAAGKQVLSPIDGSVIVRSFPGTSRSTFDATESGLWRYPVTDIVASNRVKNMVSPTVMATPPTITQSASDLMPVGATYKYHQPVTANNAANTPPDTTAYPLFRISGGPVINTEASVFACACRTPVRIDGTYPICSAWRIAFDFDGADFQFIGLPVTSGNFFSFRVWANEQPITVPRTLTAGATTNASPTVTVASTAGLLAGEHIVGAGIPFGAHIASVDSGTQVTLSVNATATATGLTFTTPGLIKDILKYVKIDFGSRAQRRILIEVTNSIGTLSPIFKGISLRKTDSIKPPSIQTSRIVFVGDSYTQGIDGTVNADHTRNWSHYMARSLGLEDIYTFAGQPSTGMVTATAAYAAYSARMPDVYALNPAVVVFQVSFNDVGSAAGAVQTALTNLIAGCRTNIPNAKIIIEGMMFPGTPTDSRYLTIAAEGKAAAVAAGVPFVDFVTATPPKFSGTGKISATTGDGNADYYMGVDLIHPAPAGHEEIGRLAAQGAAPALGLVAA